MNTDQIKKTLDDTQEFLDGLGKFIDENFLIEGKTIVAWRKYFKIEMPSKDEDITFHTLVGLSREIIEKYQKAAYFRDKQTIQLTVLEQSKFDTYHKEYQKVRTETEAKFNKPLAAESCKVHATLATMELEAALSTQKVVRDFWAKTCDTLTELRKLVEILGYALSADAKAQRDFVIKTEQ